MQSQNEINFQLGPIGNSSVIGTQPIKKKRALIGRGQVCDIIIAHSSVSSIHAVIEQISTTEARIYDMNSKNGTLVNGEKAIVSSLKIGDTITLGGMNFTFSPFSQADLMPPPLDMIDPLESLKGKLPAAIPDIAAPSISPQRMEVPLVEYPLEKDPKAEFSEYIFEETGKLYPIFKYDSSFLSTEVIIVFKDRIHSIDYIPGNDGTYSLVGSNPSDEDVEFPYLGQSDKWPIVESRGRESFIHPLPGYDFLSLADEKREAPRAPFSIQHNEIVRFENQDIQIFIRTTDSPPSVAHAPVFQGDKDLKKYLVLLLLLMTTFIGGISLIEVDKEKEEEKVPERIATILYKRRPKKITVTPSVKLNKPKEKKNVVKKPKISPQKPKKIVKKNSPKKAVTKASKTPKKSGKKTAKNKRPVKKATPNKGPRDIKKDIVRPGKAAKKTGGKRSTAKPSKSRKNAVKSPGRVDFYKSADFKSSLSSLLRKGGTTSSVRTARATESSLGESGVSEASPGATLRRANVSKNIGSLSGAAKGRIDSKQGTGDLVDKSKIYTAGLPYKTVIVGGIDPDIIRKILIDHIPQFRFCYQKELDKASRIFNGVVSLNFIIGASGNVSRAGVKSKSSLPTKVRGCVVNVLRGIKFPEPLGGGVVEVNQPLNFYPRSK